MVRASIRKLLASPLVDAIIRVTVVLSLGVGGFAWLETQGLAECVATYNNANNARSVALTQATDQERAAERIADSAQAALFLSPILNEPLAQRTPAERTELVRLFRAYQVALTEQTNERAAADDARRDHPIPDPPNEVCD
jgi:hypothetical protein